MKILIIEDNIDINNLLRDILIKENYEVRQCFTAMEALLQKDLEEFDLMILDLMMPVKSGEEFIKEIIREVQIITNNEGANLCMPIRIATTFSSHGPELAKTICYLGREKVLKNLINILKILD